MEETSGEEKTVEFSQNSGRLVVSSTKQMSLEEILKENGVDQNTWFVKKFKIHTSWGYRKDRSVDWKVKNGIVEHGEVHDTGKMLVVAFHHHEVDLERKVVEVNYRQVMEDLKETAKQYSPTYPKLEFKRPENGLLFEISMPDLHFGRLTWAEESGEDYDIKIAEEMVKRAVTTLLGEVTKYPIEKIVLPFGNDYFNVNSKANTTVNGTPQQEDTRWQKTFRKGRELAVWVIDACSSVAPTDVVIISGNHDEEKMFFLGDVLEAWYHGNPMVSVDNRAPKRKYYAYGKVLLGFTHGCDLKIDKLFGLMPVEVAKEWSGSLYREWHIGHLHQTKATTNNIHQELGITIRTMRSLVPADAWTYNSGYIGGLRAAEGLVWDPENGLLAQFTASAAYSSQ